MQLASGCSDGSIQVWDATSGTTITILRHSNWVNSVVFTPDGLLLAASGVSVQLLDPTLDGPIVAWEDHLDWILNLTFSPDGSQLASASGTHSIQLWDAISGKATATLTSHIGLITAFAFSLDGSQLASASKSVQLWDTISGSSTLEICIPIPQSRGDSVAFSPDGLQLALGCTDGSISIWNAITGRHIRSLIGPIYHYTSVRSVAFSPDGLQLVSASHDSVRLWNVTSGTSIPIHRGNLSKIYDIAFSVDAQTLIVKSIEGAFLLDISQPRRPFVALIHPTWSFHGRWITMQRFPGNRIKRICYIPPSYTCETEIGVVGSPLQSRVAFACTDGRVVLLDTQHCL